MIIGNTMDTEKIVINSPEVKEASMKVLVSPKEGWESHVMREMTVGVGGHTPKHQHNWPHINYVVEGEGTLLIEDTLHPLSPGSYAFVPENTLHQFTNTGTSTFKFLCIVPNEGHK